MVAFQLELHHPAVDPHPHAAVVHRADREPDGLGLVPGRNLEIGLIPRFASVAPIVFVDMALSGVDV